MALSVGRWATARVSYNWHTKMPKFRVFIHGVNFHMRDADSPNIEPLGFYVTAYVEAASSEAVEYASVDLLPSPKTPRGGSQSARGSTTGVFEEIQELADWPTDCALPLSGFAFYNDTDEDEDNDPKSANT